MPQNLWISKITYFYNSQKGNQKEGDFLSDLDLLIDFSCLAIALMIGVVGFVMACKGKLEKEEEEVEL